MNKFRRFNAFFMIMLMCLFQASVTQAAMVSTHGAIQTQQIQMDRAEIIDLLAQDELRAQLTQMGVDVDKAAERVANMTSLEISQLNDKLSQMPAGEGVGSVLLVILIIFIITDVIGATDIFTFIRPVR